MNPRAFWPVLLLAAVGMTGAPIRLLAANPPGPGPSPASPQEAYWWQDELRTAAFAVSQARSGQVSQWPRLLVSPGSATLPLPKAQGVGIVCDGKLDEAAWSSATAFPVGPIFGPWRQGPFVLRVRACRDDRQVYLAIESPCDLTGLSALDTSGVLFEAGGKAVAFPDDGGSPPQNTPAGTPGKVPGGAFSAKKVRAPSGWVAELALPAGPGATRLTFYPEVVRRVGGRLPPALACLGIDRVAQTRGSRGREAVWLAPIEITLVPSAASAQLSYTVDSPAQVTLSCRLGDALGQDGKPHVGRSVLARLGEKGQPGFFPYAWSGQAAGAKFHAEGFFYVEPVAGTLQAARGAADRARALGAIGEADLKALLADIDAATAQAKGLPASDGPARRAAFCRARALRARAHLAMLDAPLLFVKRHPYYAAHIYDDFYTWHPGGGIYILDNPAAPDAATHRARPLIDPATKPTLGGGVYRDPEVHWDAKRVLFAHKAEAPGCTSIYEIDLATHKLRRLTDPARDMAEKCLLASASEYPGHHDFWPAYLGDDRIVFTSTRPGSLVPCFNSTVGMLHVMNADGSGIRSISVNNVSEFDPVAMPDGRILYGRWEYVDKTALYMQSLWTIHPDGTNETALFGNNLAKPTAILNARPVPGSPLVVASLTPHNGQAVGAIGMIDTEYEKNSRSVVTNFTPEYPVAMDQGLAVGPSDPWPLSKDDVLISNNALGGHGVIELIDRAGNRELAHCDPAISCYAPMLIKPRPRPAVTPEQAKPYASGRPGEFAVLDVYQGLPGVKPGEVKYLRVIEETSRSSGLPPGGRWWNQAFLISWQGGYTVKNYLGVVPVEPDGSAHFQAPSGKALYLQALDAQGRQVQSMRTFVQAAPDATRSCIGCHEYKFGSPPPPGAPPRALRRPPDQLAEESWGSGYIDYPAAIQPILDRHCVRCHGGADGLSGGIDLSGGWTWAFNISYETLLKNTLVGFLNCENGRVQTSDLLPPRRIGSGSAPLGDLLVSGHKDRIPNLSRAERDMIFAWMDGNSCYYGTWNYTPHATCRAILDTAGELAAAMGRAGCTSCHGPGHVGNDWINLRTPERSRILRAPLSAGKDGLGLGWCRDRKAPAGLPPITERNQPPDVFTPARCAAPDPKGTAHVSFASTRDARYQEMLAIIRRGRAAALANPRVDMPGARITPGVCRQLSAAALPSAPPALRASLTADAGVLLQWHGTGRTIGLTFEVHRGKTLDFAPSADTLLGTTPWFAFSDPVPPPGEQHYAMVAASGQERSRPARVAVTVPQPPPPGAPVGLAAEPGPGEVTLRWDHPNAAGVTYNVYRAPAGSSQFARLNDEPLGHPIFVDSPVPKDVRYTYVVRAVDRRGQTGEPSAPATAAGLAYVGEPMFVAPLAKDLAAALYGGGKLVAKAQGPAKVAGGALDLGAGGHVTFPHRGHFDIAKALSVECWVRIESPSQMPVILACGFFDRTGWFVQLYSGQWRWHLGGVSCDGGQGATGKWVHLACTFNGRVAELYQNGRRVASVPCAPNLEPWTGPLVVGQYSQPAESFQVIGRIGGVKVYRRALSAQEAAASFKAGPPSGQ